MKVYLLRHGIAADVGGKITSDGERPLTADGIAIMKEEARGMNKLGVSPDRILSSPLVRAHDTAKVVADILGCADMIEIVNSLSIPCDRQALVKRLAKEDPHATVMLVGHDPDMSQLPGYLIGLPSLRIPFKKGTLCRVDVTGFAPKADGEIRLLLHPKQLRSVYR